MSIDSTIPHAQALQSYLDILKDAEKYARQRMKQAIADKTPKISAPQLENRKRLLQALDDCNRPAKVAGIKAGWSGEYMTSLLDAVNQACSKFELNLKRSFEDGAVMGPFIQGDGSAFTELDQLIQGKMRMISEMIAVSDSQSASLAITSHLPNPEAPPTLTHTEQQVLKALKRLKALNKDSRSKGREIKHLVDRETSVPSLNTSLAKLGRLNYIQSLDSGGNGGYWITEMGLAKINQNGKITKEYTFGQLLRDLERNKPIQKGNVNRYVENRLRAECARKYATDITSKTVQKLRDELCLSLASPPASIDAMDAETVINLIAGVNKVSLQDGMKYRQDHVKHDQYLIDYINVGAGHWQPISKADCIIVAGTGPTLCPEADPVLPMDFLPAVEARFRDLKLLKRGQNIHWVGVKSYVRNRCRCFCKDTPQYVTLSQIAFYLKKTKKTLERWKAREKNPFPPADNEGGGGKADEWIWSSIKPWLKEEIGRILPDTFPGMCPP